MRTESPMVLDTSPEAATYRTDIKGWVSRDGLFFGDGAQGERTARYSGCTHKQCECGAVAEKHRIRCDACQEKHTRADYEKLPLIEWDGETPLCIFRGDTYFWSADDLDLYCDTNDVRSTDLMLVICDPVNLHEVDIDYWSDELPEDGDLPTPVEDALTALNKAIREHGKCSAWYGGNQRVTVSLEVREPANAE